MPDAITDAMRCVFPILFMEGVFVGCPTFPSALLSPNLWKCGLHRAVNETTVHRTHGNGWSDLLVFLGCGLVGVESRQECTRTPKIFRGGRGDLDRRAKGVSEGDMGYHRSKFRRVIQRVTRNEDPHANTFACPDF